MSTSWETPQSGVSATTRGTCHFVDMAAAVRYYRPYGFDRDDVANKLREHEIEIGPPATKPGETLSVIPDEGRYAVTVAD